MMKLLYKYSRINLITSVIIFLLAGLAFYFLLHFIFVKQMDEDLLEEQNEIFAFVKKNNSLPEIIPSNDEVTTYENTESFSPVLSYSTVYLTKNYEKEAYRQLQFFINADGKPFRIHISKSLENTDHIIKSVILVSAITILLLLIANFVINRIVLRRLWKPFYKTMKAMKEYRIGKKAFPEFQHTDIEEFTALNETLHTAIRQAENEYEKLKEFTENASHEMQTPVAVIRSKMDVLIQDEHLSESQSQIVQDAYVAIQRLARLNQTLLLLSKIENRQFTERENISMNMLVEEKLVSFREILQNKQLNIIYETAPVSIKMNLSLADVLLNNLFSNCIKHSLPGDQLKIVLTADHLSFSNGPAQIPLNSHSIFTRFYKGGNSSDQHGLGLAIVKEICAVSGFSVEYLFEGGMHLFIVKWN